MMHGFRFAMRCALLMLVLSGGVRAQDFGDTPYVQTPQVVVDAMLKTAKVTARDYVIDLGSGDGRMVISAAQQKGARGFGVDLDKRLVQLANANAQKAGVADRAKFYARDLFETDLSPASVITIYLLPEVNLMARSKLLALAPGTRIVSHDYGIGDWPPDVQFEMDAPGKSVGRIQRSKVLYWVVPDLVAGRWMWQIDAGGKSRTVELTLQQNYQKIEATAIFDGRAVPVEQAKLTGRLVEFSLVLPVGSGGRMAFSGQRVAQMLEGEMRSIDGKNTGKTTPWRATRIEIRDAAHVIAPPPVIREFVMPK